MVDEQVFSLERSHFKEQAKSLNDYAMQGVKEVLGTLGGGIVKEMIRGAEIGAKIWSVSMRMSTGQNSQTWRQALTQASKMMNLQKQMHIPGNANASAVISKFLGQQAAGGVGSKVAKGTAAGAGAGTLGSGATFGASIAIGAGIGLIIGVLQTIAESIMDFPLIVAIMKILKIIMMILLLPLIPILKPVLLALGELAKFLMTPEGQDTSKGILWAALILFTTLLAIAIGPLLGLTVVLGILGVVAALLLAPFILLGVIAAVLAFTLFFVVAPLILLAGIALMVVASLALFGIMIGLSLIPIGALAITVGLVTAALFLLGSPIGWVISMMLLLGMALLLFYVPLSSLIGLVRNFIEVITAGVAKFLTDVAAGESPIVAFWNDIIKPALTFVGEALKGAWNLIIQPAFKGALKPVQDSLWSTIIKPAFDYLVKQVKAWADALIAAAIKKAASIISSASSTTKVSDAIIAPGGNIITTNPQDYLIATKDPMSLMGGGNGSVNITINMNNTKVNDTADIKKLTEEISRTLQRQFRGYVSYGNLG